MPARDVERLSQWRTTDGSLFTEQDAAYRRQAFNDLAQAFPMLSGSEIDVLLDSADEVKEILEHLGERRLAPRIMR